MSKLLMLKGLPASGKSTYAKELSDKGWIRVNKDDIVKFELFKEHVEPVFNIKFVLDDRNQVVDMWRNELGLKVLQVAEGDF